MELDLSKPVLKQYIKFIYNDLKYLSELKERQGKYIRAIQGGSRTPPQSRKFEEKLLRAVSRVLTVLAICTLMYKYHKELTDLKDQLTSHFQDLPGVKECRERLNKESTFLRVITEKLFSTTPTTHCGTVINANAVHWQSIQQTVFAWFTVLAALYGRSLSKGRTVQDITSDIILFPAVVFDTIANTVEIFIRKVIGMDDSSQRNLLIEELSLTVKAIKPSKPKSKKTKKKKDEDEENEAEVEEEEPEN